MLGWLRQRGGKSRPSDQKRLALLLEKLATMDLKPKRVENGWQYFGRFEGELERAVTLDDFFVGNPNTAATFAANLSKHPREDEIYKLCKSIKSRDDVHDVFVGVGIIDYMDSEKDAWVYSDTLYIVTSSNEQAIISWFGAIFPDEVYPLKETQLNPLFGLMAPPEGYKLYRVWWD